MSRTGVADGVGEPTLEQIRLAHFSLDCGCSRRPAGTRESSHCPVARQYPPSGLPGRSISAFVRIAAMETTDEQVILKEIGGRQAHADERMSVTRTPCKAFSSVGHGDDRKEQPVHGPVDDSGATAIPVLARPFFACKLPEYQRKAPAQQTDFRGVQLFHNFGADVPAANAGSSGKSGQLCRFSVNLDRET